MLSIIVPRCYSNLVHMFLSLNHRFCVVSIFSLEVYILDIGTTNRQFLGYHCQIHCSGYDLVTSLSTHIETTTYFFSVYSLVNDSFQLSIIPFLLYILAIFLLVRRACHLTTLFLRFLLLTWVLPTLINASFVSSCDHIVQHQMNTLC